MRVLVACEFSGRVRDAFLAARHDAVSCDLLPSQSPGPHYVGDVFEIINNGWDMMIAFPPCTYLCVSGARWWAQRRKEQSHAIEFFMMLASAPIARIAIENPIGLMSTVWRKPDQIVHPWMFGHGETKATCLWLQGLPNLKPTAVVAGRENRIHKMPPTKDRGMMRSLTYQGVANAMATQWGNRQ